LQYFPPPSLAFALSALHPLGISSLRTHSLGIDLKNSSAFLVLPTFEATQYNVNKMKVHGFTEMLVLNSCLFFIHIKNKVHYLGIMHILLVVK
jgi:hypothetical protein